MPFCAVPRCKAKIQPFHAFPIKDKELMNIWKSCVSNNSINLLNDEEICQKYIVCDDHFVDSCKLSGTNGLKKYSIPTINVSGFKSNSNLNVIYNSYIAKQENDPINQSLKNITLDHNYVDTILTNYNTSIGNEDLDNCALIDLSVEQKPVSSVREIWIEPDLQLTNQNSKNIVVYDPLSKNTNDELVRLKQEDEDISYFLEDETIFTEQIVSMDDTIIFEGKLKEEPVFRTAVRTYTGPGKSNTKETFILAKKCAISHIKCSAPNCSNKYGSFHKFPSDPILCKKWKKSLGITKTIKDHMKVCCDHFTDSDFFPKSICRGQIERQLKRTAIPFNYTKEKLTQSLQICAAKYCFNNFKDHENVYFFPFPSNETLARVWALNANREDLLFKENFYENRFLCADHFETMYFKNASRAELKQDIAVVPSIFNINDSIGNPEDLYSLEDNLMAHLNELETKQTNDKPDKPTKIGRSNILQTYINDSDTTKITFVEKSTKSLINFDFGKLAFSDNLYDDFILNPGVLNLKPNANDLLIKKDYCRLCAKLCPVASLLPIFDNNQTDFTIYGKMLDTCLPGQVHQQDKLPQWMCYNCEYKLDVCCSSIKVFMEANNYLKKILLIDEETNIGDNIRFVNQTPLNNIKPKNNLPSTNNDKIVEEVKINDEVPPNIPPEINKIIEQKQVEKNNKYQCLNCKQLYNTKKELIDHSLVKHYSDRTRNKIVCKIVPKETTPQSKAENTTAAKPKPNNSKSRFSNLRYECVVCSSHHEKKDALVKHTLRCHSEYSKGKIVCRVVRINNFKKKHLTCLHCKEEFRNVAKYRKHMQQHLKLNCDECGVHFRKMFQLLAHIKKHKVKTFTCPECADVFEEKSELVKHELTTHSKQSDSIDMKCSLCDEQFNSVVELSKHKKKHERSLCNICGKLFASSTILKYHLEKHSDVRSHKCAVCSKAFKTIVSLKQHEQTHSTEKKYICQMCGKQFGYLSILKSHMYSHSTHRPHVCDLCGAAFHQKNHLAKHVRTHARLKENPYKCKICQLDFSSKVTYIRHKREHVDDKKTFTCDICAKKFLTKFQAKIHRRIHTGETPYNCEQCGKSFRSMALVKQHKLIHMNVFPHQCNYCDRKFRRLQSLVVHRKTHTGERPFPCPICGRAFANRSDMNKHKRNLHNRKNKEQPNVEEHCKLSTPLIQGNDTHS